MPAKSPVLAGQSDPGNRPVDQPFDISDRAQAPAAARPAPAHRRRSNCDAVEPRFDRAAVEQRLTQPTAKQAAAHGGARLVEYREQTMFPFAASALGQLKITPRLIVERHESVHVVGASV